MEIAVLVNYDGKTSLFTENGTIKVFSKDASGWNLVREKEYIVEDLSDGNELRNCLGDVSVWLNDCKILIENASGASTTWRLNAFRYPCWRLTAIPKTS